MNRSEYREYAAKGAVNRGNRQSIRLCMRRAMAGDTLTLGFLGGSITQGSRASSPENCYASLVCDWWKRTFPKAGFAYLTAGVGGTTSQFGVARVREDLLTARPDFVVVEFSVNDDPTDFYEETYEGLIRAIEESNPCPAVLLLHNVRYDSGVSAETQHAAIGKAYQLPCVSMKPSLYRAVQDGTVSVAEISPDGLHPNDFGHRLIADTVNYFLEEIRLDLRTEERLEPLPPPVTPNRFQHSRRLQNSNCIPENCSGFVADHRAQNGVRDCFKHGWTASRAGASIMFRTKGTGFAVQYRKSMQHPAPVATAVLDGDEAHAVTLDGNFDETWGDSLSVTNIARDLTDQTHCLEVRVVEADAEPTADFYLVSVIVSG